MKLRPPVKPLAVVVKRSRRRVRAKTKCVVCGAVLRGDHCAGDLVCDCHPASGYNPRHDPCLDERVLVLLYRAKGQPLNLYRALGCDPFPENYKAVDEAVRRLNASGVVCVKGAGRAGRQLQAIPKARGPKVET